MRKNNVDEYNRPCSGCGACTIICPGNAITMRLDREGFYCAVIDEKQCIHCGKCKSVCIRSGEYDGAQLKDGKVLAAQSGDQSTVKASTSGGIAYEMARAAFTNGMGVVGVVYDFERNRAESILAKSLNDIEQFRGSKYIQSFTMNAFQEMLFDMSRNRERKYLVFGTPCQVYGLASALEKEQLRDRVILVDLFCHGVPSYLVWDKYLELIQKRLGATTLTDIVFRDKSIGWHNFVMKISSRTGEYKEPSEGDLFYHAFFDNVLFAKACFTCPVRQNISKADVRLGDYWGQRFQAREDGISAILLLSETGRAFLRSIQDSLQIFESGSVDEVLASQSVYPYNTLPYRENAFSSLINGNSLKSVIKTYRRSFPASKRLLLILKEGSAKLPNGLRAVVRKIYKQI